MPIDIDIVLSRTRQNTGRSLLDSGDYYGRVYETPAPCGLFSVARDGDVSLALTGLLAQTATLVTEFQARLDAAWGSGSRDGGAGFTGPDGEFVNTDALDQFEIGPAVMEAFGYVRVSRDNTYNGEQDLDQNFVYEVWQSEANEGSREWIYDETAVVLVYAHTGCDVRGGYSTPLAVRFDGEYSIPVDLMVSFSPADAAAEEWCIRHNFAEGYFEAGYTANPQYRLREAVGDFVAYDLETQTLTFVNPDHGDEGGEEPATVAFACTYNGAW